MKYYITKYAMSQGILRLDAELCESSPNLIMHRDENYSQYFGRGEWHVRWSDALEKAERMKQNRIISLQKALDKAKGMTFKQPD